MAIGSVVFCGCNPSEPPVVPPKIMFHESAHDFGRVALGARITHTFAFHNGGGLDLAVENVRASCDCTVAAPSSRLLHPGDDADLAVTLDTTRDVGHKTYTITVYSNDPAQPVTTLSLVGDIDAEVAADPPALYVGHVHRGQAAPNEIRLVSKEGVAVGSPETRSKVIDANVHAAATGTRLRISIKPDAPPGRFKDTVTVRTSSTRQPTVTISVVGVVDAEPRG